MDNYTDEIHRLEEKLTFLIKQQSHFFSEINNLKREIRELKAKISENKESTKQPEVTEEIKKDIPVPIQPTPVAEEKLAEAPKVAEKPKEDIPEFTAPSKRITIIKSPDKNSNIEKFIGENLISKIGIAITIIGVAIGAKYAIEHQLVSPLTRIILGYIFGLGLLGFAIKLKPKYENYSAVLLSGAMAIMYFITYAGYTYYNLFPQVVTFIIMVILTVFTVVSAWNYNKQIIAHFGLVGAYAVPFLLSDGSDKVITLFSYVAIINAGISVISIKKYWKPLYYVAFGLTWLLFGSWYMEKFTDPHLGIALIFSSLFFLIHYSIFLIYKLKEKEKFNVDDILILLSNSFLFFAVGHSALSEHEIGKHYLGLFTLLNACIHFGVAYTIFTRKQYDKNLFYLITGLVLLFITIAFPIQLDGNWVTLFWAGEAVLLYWIGTAKHIKFYTKASYPLLLLTLISLVHDWITMYSSFYDPLIPETRLTLFFNIAFLTSVLVIAAYGGYYYIFRKYNTVITNPKQEVKLLSFGLPVLITALIYLAIRLEIQNYWHQLYKDSHIVLDYEANTYNLFNNNYNLKKFSRIYILMYSLLFFSGIALINFKKWKNEVAGYIIWGVLSFTILVFLIQGLYEVSELRDNYLHPEAYKFYHIGIFNIVIRYIALVVVIFSLWCFFQFHKQQFLKKKLKTLTFIAMHISILWLLSSELITWMYMANVTEAYKVGLSILWGTYALFLMLRGILKKIKELRFIAIAILGITIIKLFLYDLNELGTLSKTFVSIILGIFLLIISFLYNKYKTTLFNEED